MGLEVAEICMLLDDITKDMLYRIILNFQLL